MYKLWCRHIHINTSIGNDLFLHSDKLKFTLMSPTLIHYHVDHFSLLLLLISIFPLQQGETWHPPSTIHLLIHSNTWTPVSELLICSTMTNNLIRLQGLNAWLFYPLVLQTPLISKVMLKSYSSIHSMRVLYI